MSDIPAFIAQGPAQWVGTGEFKDAAPPAPESVLLEAQSLVHGNRGADYGHPLDDYTRTAAMVSGMLEHILIRPIQADEMIMVMICVKLSRQVNKPKRDNTVDGAGYFECLQMAIDEYKRRNQGDQTSE